MLATGGGDGVFCLEFLSLVLLSPPRTKNHSRVFKKDNAYMEDLLLVYLRSWNVVGWTAIP